MIRVVIADPQLMIRSGLKTILEHSGKLTIVAEAETSAILPDKVEEFKPDLVIADVSLCDINVLRQLKVQFPVPKVILFSSFAEDDYDCILRSFAAGADGYIPKTATPSRFLQAIDAVFNHSCCWMDIQTAQRIFVNLVENLSMKNSRHDKLNLAEPLTQRESQILNLLTQGLSNNEISKTLGLNPETVKTHLRHIMEKLHVRNRTEAAVKSLLYNVHNSAVEGDSLSFSP